MYSILQFNLICFANVLVHIVDLSFPEDMLVIVGSLLEKSHWLIKAVAFDGHLANTYFREALRGHFVISREEDLATVAFFRDVRYESFPRTCLPRLPARICRYGGEAVWPLCGPCASTPQFTNYHKLYVFFFGYL